MKTVLCPHLSHSSQQWPLHPHNPLVGGQLALLHCSRVYFPRIFTRGAEKRWKGGEVREKDGSEGEVHNVRYKQQEWEEE